MTATTHSDQTNESSFAPLFGHALEGWTLGVDGEHQTHAYYKPANAVVVHRGRELEHVEYLGDRTREEWIAFIDQTRGWV